MTTILDGNRVAKELLDQTAAHVRALVASTGVVPCLATVLCGDDPASATYVRMKARRCEAVGMRSLRVALPATTGTAELTARIAALGADPAVHGILLQHPVPRHIDERAAFEAIPAAKDVDGVTVHNLGAMALGLGSLHACTPAGIMRLLAAYQVPLAGTRAVVVGRSPILGKPMAYLLTNADATVTLCHSRTRDLPALIGEADLVVAAVGKPRFVRGEWVRIGAVVVDAGYNEGNVGDVDYEAAAARASMITPVPGGVGPMTIATLIEQTAKAAAAQLGAPGELPARA